MVAGTLEKRSKYCDFETGGRVDRGAGLEYWFYRSVFNVELSCFQPDV
jgi:hypothetical protein